MCTFARRLNFVKLNKNAHGLVVRDLPVRYLLQTRVQVRNDGTCGRGTCVIRKALASPDSQPSFLARVFEVMCSICICASQMIFMAPTPVLFSNVHMP